MNAILKTFLLLITFLTLSCGEEMASKGTHKVDYQAPGVIAMSSESCGSFHYVKPPVDILVVIDNSGSTNNSRFAQVRTQIANIINSISNDFDYHIYVAPLFPIGNESKTSYPLIISGTPNTVPGYSSNLINIENLPYFQARGNNYENGIDRIIELIDANKDSIGSTGKVFRRGTNLLTVMISSGDDNSICEYIAGTQGSIACDNNKFNLKKQKLLSYLDDNAVVASAVSESINLKTMRSIASVGGLNAESLRFITLVPHSNCNSFRVGTSYKLMSQEIYQAQGLTDDPSFRDSRDICGGNYEALFSAVNSSIRKVLIEHKYDHWVINPNNVAIQQNDIILKKIKANGQQELLSPNQTNGYQYLGYKVNQPTRYAPDSGEPQTGLMVKLFGNARVTYPECIVSKTRTPTEYFGYVTLKRKPDLSTVIVEKNGQVIPRSTTNGWESYYNNDYMDTINIKIQGPGSYSEATPAINQSGYVIKLYGDAIYSNSDSIRVTFKPADL